MQRLIDFSRYSSIKIGPVVAVEVIEQIDPKNEALFLIGGANNLLVGPTPPPLAILGKNFDYIRVEKGELIIGARTTTGKVVSFCEKHDIAVFEFLSKLPGTIGGAVKMNAGVKEYEIKDRLLWVRTYEGKIPASELGLAYRKSDIAHIVYEAGFRIEPGFSEELRQELVRLRTNQPKEPSAGSIFKNPPGDYAGRLIEAVGLKGKRVGNMAWSSLHANFLINLGGGTFDEAITLIDEAKYRVYEEFGVRLQEEIIIL